MIKIRIEGELNDGLTAKKGLSTLLSSEVKYNWFKPDFIHIYDQHKVLQLTINHSKGFLKTTYKVSYQIKENDNYIKSIKNGLLEISNGEKILFKKNFFYPITNPHSEIIFQKKKIGYVNFKRFKLFGLDFTLFLEENSKELLTPILTYLLVTESNSERGD